MATLIEDVLDKRTCDNHPRLLGFLWRVRCGGRLTVKPSNIHPGRDYTICQKCGAARWPRQKIRTREDPLAEVVREVVAEYDAKTSNVQQD